MPFEKTRDPARLSGIAREARKDVLRMLVEAKSGHTAGPLGMADVFTALYFSCIDHDPKNPQWDGRDRVILSNGHICPIHYAILARAGYFPLEELKTLRKLGSRLQGHPHRGALPGIENSSGPLGQGLAQACGIALAARLDKKNFRTIALLSDGEHDEGSTWEAVMFAAKYKLDSLVAIVDRNFIQIDGDTENVMPLEPFADKYRAFGWNVIEIDGHDFAQIIDAYEKAAQAKGKPTAIIAKVTPGKGVKKFENDYKWHGKAPSAQEAEEAIAELDRGN
ncbi:MAG: transketolase [Candidatus Micrarchaeia archaeon]